MRLIDLDEIEYFTLVDKYGVPRYKIEIGDGLPIVKAIPIEWIENWLETCIPRYDYDRMTYVADVYEMLEDWEKENEKDI